MAYYCVNKKAQSNGDHEVHKVGCSWYPNEENRVLLGDHSHCSFAVSKAIALGYHTANGCAHCSPDCNTG